MAQDQSEGHDEGGSGVVRRADHVDTHVGQRVKLRRLDLGLSQEKVASLCDLTFQQIQKYEKGINRISAGRLHSLAQALNCSIDFFFADLPAHQASPKANANAVNGRQTSIADLLKSRDALKLVEAFNRIDEDALRKAIVRLVCDAAGERFEAPD